MTVEELKVMMNTLLVCIKREDIQYQRGYVDGTLDLFNSVKKKIESEATNG